MGKWGYLARAYAISDYAYLRATEAENNDARTDDEANELNAVIDDVKTVMELAAENYGDSIFERRTYEQCKRFLKDFDENYNEGRLPEAY